MFIVIIFKCQTKTHLVINVARGKNVYFYHDVNWEIFARTLFSRNFAYTKFLENENLAKWQNHSVVY